MYKMPIEIKIQERIIKLIVIIILSIISIILLFYFEGILRTSILYSHFFYFPIILSCLWWKKKGLIVPACLAGLLILGPIFMGSYILSIDSIDNIFRAFLLIIIGFVVAMLSENISKTQSKLTEAMEELKRSNEELQQFAYAASHDLQEPLRTIISFSQLLEDQYKDKIDKNGQEFIQFMTEGASRMRTLINDLLKYSRITTQSQPLQKVNLNDILKTVLSNLQQLIKESDATITYKELPSIFINKSHMLQLFQNLISNALKFKKETPPKIYIDAIKNENEWIFSVKDNGIGIEEKFFDRIFNIFQRLHTREEYPGAGIGLAICKKIIQRYNGKIWVESKIGEGSTFYFTIPINK